MKKYFNSFEGLRIFAFLNVFLLHIGSYRITSFHNNSTWAVSFFFMVSGFLYSNKMFEKNIKMSDIKTFSLKKILMVYPLYLITLLLMLPFSEIISINGFNNELYFFIKKLLYNLTMTQSFVSDLSISYAFNGVAWFLSDFIFFMIITIPILILLKKQKKECKFFFFINVNVIININEELGE